MISGRIIVLSAPSGSGKGTVIGKLLSINKGISPSISYTSRTPRPSERDGEHYFFITKERFTSMIDKGEFIEWDHYQGDYYGTSKGNILCLLDSGADVIFDITITGAYAIRAHFPQAALVFLLPPSFEELEKRLRNRGTETEEKIMGRLTEARREIGALEKFDYYIINDDAERAALRLNAIITAEKCRIFDEEAAIIMQRVMK